jgi:hypothetical protein
MKDGCGGVGFYLKTSGISDGGTGLLSIEGKAFI